MDTKLHMQNKNFTRNDEKVTEVPRCECQSGGELRQTMHWNMAELVKISSGITMRQHVPIDPRQNCIAEQAVQRVKEGMSPILPQSGLDEK